MKEPPAVEKSPAVKEPLVLKEPPAFKESPAASKYVRQGSSGQRDLPKEMLVLKEPPAVKEPPAAKESPAAATKHMKLGRSGQRDRDLLREMLSLQQKESTAVRKDARRGGPEGRGDCMARPLTHKHTQDAAAAAVSAAATPALLTGPTVLKTKPLSSPSGSMRRPTQSQSQRQPQSQAAQTQSPPPSLPQAQAERRPHTVSFVDASVSLWSHRSPGPHAFIEAELMKARLNVQLGIDTGGGSNIVGPKTNVQRAGAPADFNVQLQTGVLRDNLNQR